MLSKKLGSPGKPGNLGIVPGFPRFFAHRGKPGKLRAFLLGFPGFGGKIPGFPGNRGILEKPGKCGVSWLSMLSGKVWKAKRLHAFLESEETPSFPGFSLCAKKCRMPGIFRNSADFLALFLQGKLPFKFLFLNTFNVKC